MTLMAQYLSRRMDSCVDSLKIAKKIQRLECCLVTDKCTSETKTASDQRSVQTLTQTTIYAYHIAALTPLRPSSKTLICSSLNIFHLSRQYKTSFWRLRRPQKPLWQNSYEHEAGRKLSDKKESCKFLQKTLRTSGMLPRLRCLK